VVTNIGKVEHEFVVLKTNKPAGNLLKGNRCRRGDRRCAAGSGEDAQPHAQSGALRAHLQPARPLQDRPVLRLLRSIDRLLPPRRRSAGRRGALCVGRTSRRSRPPHPISNEPVGVFLGDEVLDLWCVVLRKQTTNCLGSERIVS
jgi:hypothetical protein